MNKVFDVIPQWIINFVLTLLLVAYGVIFDMVCDRINANTASIEKINAKVDSYNPIFSQIQSDLSEIKTDLKWLKLQK